MRKARRRRPTQIINHKSEGVPLPMGRVARIVTKFCARTTPQNGATPCAARNKEFLARGVFYLFHWCTNGTKSAGN
jgi:hypothetical protein